MEIGAVRLANSANDFGPSLPWLTSGALARTAPLPSSTRPLPGDSLRWLAWASLCPDLNHSPSSSGCWSTAAAPLVGVGAPAAPADASPGERSASLPESRSTLGALVTSSWGEPAEVEASPGPAAALAAARVRSLSMSLRCAGLIVAGLDVGVDVFAGLGGALDASAAAAWGAAAEAAATPECAAFNDASPSAPPLSVERPLPLSKLDVVADVGNDGAGAGGGEGCSRNVLRALPTTAADDDSRSTLRRCLATMRAVESIIQAICKDVLTSSRTGESTALTRPQVRRACTLLACPERTPIQDRDILQDRESIHKLHPQRMSPTATTTAGPGDSRTPLLGDRGDATGASGSDNASSIQLLGRNLFGDVRALLTQVRVALTHNRGSVPLCKGARA